MLMMWLNNVIIHTLLCNEWNETEAYWREGLLLEDEASGENLWQANFCEELLKSYRVCTYDGWKWKPKLVKENLRQRKVSHFFQASFDIYFIMWCLSIRKVTDGGTLIVMVFIQKCFLKWNVFFPQTLTRYKIVQMPVCDLIYIFSVSYSLKFPSLWPENSTGFVCL